MPCHELVVRRIDDVFSEVKEDGVVVLSATHADVAEYVRLRLDGQDHLVAARAVNDRWCAKVPRRYAEMEILP